MDLFFMDCARKLLGADPWRNGAVACSELGWHVSGFARGVRSVALRRARCWFLPADDWYKSFFLHATDMSVGWSGSSASLLDKWSIPDWRSVSDLCPMYASYKKHVDSLLQWVCTPLLVSECSKHNAQVPYAAFQSSPSDVLATCFSMRMPWHTLMQLRGWCRMRAGLPCLRTLGGRVSHARRQRCIFCNTGVRNATVHTLVVCPSWGELRSAFILGMRYVAVPPADRLTLDILGASPRAHGFPAAVALCDAIDSGASQYWQSRDT